MASIFGDDDDSDDIAAISSCTSAFCHGDCTGREDSPMPSGQGADLVENTEDARESSNDTARKSARIDRSRALVKGPGVPGSSLE